MVRRVWSCGLVIGSFIGLVWATAALAQQDRLTEAEVYRLRNNVQLLPQNQAPRSARLQDVLVPLDALRTAQSSIAELLFNEGSIARVDQNTTFRFQRGMRRFQLPNRVAMTETIFVLEGGTALIMSPPNGLGTQVETPGGRINIRAADAIAATRPLSLLTSQATVAEPLLVAWEALSNEGSDRYTVSDIASLPLLIGQQPSSTDLNTDPNGNSEATDEPSDLLSPPQDSSAVMVVHDPARNITQVFALTDGDITVTGASGDEATPLLGGETVAVASGQVGIVREFDLEAFYRSVPLAEGLGPGQEENVAQQPPSVQPTLNVVRVETLAAVRRQAREQSSFSRTFIQDALNGTASNLYGRRDRTNVLIINPESTAGTFVRTGERSASFIPDNDPNNPVDLTVDFDNRSIAIDGRSGATNNVGLSGNNAVGTVLFQNGRVTRIEVFGVNGREPRQQQRFRGRLTTGRARGR